MNEVPAPKAVQAEGTSESVLQQVSEPRIPQFRRDIFPSNIVLSAEDLNEFARLVVEANERAKKIEYANLNLENFDSPEQAAKRVNDLVVVEYNYAAKNGDSVQGVGIPRTGDHSFPDELKSFFISSASYCQRAIQVAPLNTIDVFFGFEKPTLKLDLKTLPSNPTENRSVININGKDEDWVISTADRVNEFLRKKRAIRPFIHGSGIYDYFVYLAFLPVVMWLYYRYAGGDFSTWFDDQSIFFNVVLGIYAFLVPLLLARFLFQYVRWLFPPIEYYKKSRFGAYVHRTVAGAIGSAVLLSTIYDLIKSVMTSLF